MKVIVFLISLFSFSVHGDTCPELTQQQQKTTITNLAEQVYQHDVFYFEDHAPRISDAEYDLLENRLNFLQDCFPEVPVTRYKPQPISRKAKHSAFMGSLKKADSKEGIEQFLRKYKSSGLILQPKIDGIAVELVYKKGVLTKAVTRGDGEFGENIIRHIRHMPLIPQQLPEAIDLVLHGELFARLDLVANRFLEKYVSVRHLVAGQVNRKKPEPAVLEGIDFFPWRWIDAPFTSEIDTLNALTNLGFKHTQKHSHRINTLEDISRWRDTYDLKKSAIFLMDGVVIKSTNINNRTSATKHGGDPDWALAWKFPAKTAVTTVINIEFSKGKTGKITPVLIVTPVTIEGRIIHRVSLGSENNLKQKGVKIGDKIRIALKGAATPIFKGVQLPHKKKAIPIDRMH